MRTGAAHTTSEGRKGPPMELVGGKTPSAGLGVTFPNWAEIAHGPAHKARAISWRIPGDGGSWGSVYKALPLTARGGALGHETLERTEIGGVRSNGSQPKAPF